MSSGSFETVRELFDRSCELDAAERNAFLDQHCVNQPEIRAKVERLLKQNDRVSAPIDESPVAAPLRSALRAGMTGGTDAGMREPHAMPLPERVGRFRILRLIGRGGMGSVYEAEQDNPKRSVALKVVRSDSASPDVLRRFEHEAQILGRLQHPGIACIHEAGIADLGSGPQPYLAMELIRGESLRGFVAKTAPNLRAKLDLFVRICDAAEHAHRAGVVHRDLKPSNILIDETGAPKIVDFGVARATTPGSAGVTMHTQTGQIMGTLTYMSPEQITGRGSAVDGRSDVYALGVILFELLAGRLPHDLENRSLAEAARIIREEDPSRLSSVNASLRGDLETIVAKALEKDAARRYASAGELASDLRRYLQDQPILARPVSAAYQLQKFARRNKQLVSGVAAAFLVLVAGLIGVSWFAVKESRQRQLAQQNEARAEWASYRNCIAAADRSLQLHDVARATRLLDSAPEKLRGWEWRYLKRISDQSLLTIQAAQNAITGVALTPDGKTILAAEERGDISAWNADDGARLWIAVRKPMTAATLALSPDGKRLLAGEASGVTSLRDVDREIPLWSIGGPATLDAQCFFADGESFALARPDGIVRIATVDGRELGPIRVVASSIASPAISANGKYLVGKSASGSVQCFDLATGEERWRSLAGEARFAPDGNSVWVYSSWSHILSLFDAATGKTLTTFEDVYGFAPSSSGRLLALFLNNGAVEVRELSSKQRIAMLRGHTAPVTGAAFSADDSRLVTSDTSGAIRVWNPFESDAVFNIRPSNDAIIYGAIAAKGDRGITAGWSGVKLWDLSTGEELWTTFPMSREMQASAYSPDESLIALAGYDRRLAIVRATDGTLVVRSPLIEPALRCVVWTKDAAHVLAGGLDGSIRVFDALSGEEKVVARPSSSAVNAMALSPDGATLAFVCADGKLQSLSVAPLIAKSDVAARAIAETRPASPADPGQQSVAYSPSGELLAAGFADGTILLFDVRTGDVLRTMRNAGSPTLSLAFSPDGARIAAGFGDATIHLFDAGTGDDLLVLPAPRAGACRVSFSADVDSLAAISYVAPGGIAVFETASTTGRIDARHNQRRARRLVDGLYERLLFSADVVAAIETDPSLAPGVRSAALRLTRARGDHPNYLNSEAWNTCCAPNRTKEEYLLAVRKAELACRIRPDRQAFFNTLGFAQLRAGLPEDALKTFARCKELRDAEGLPEHPLDVLGKALACAKLGKMKEAEKHIAQAKALAKDAGLEKDPEFGAFLAEAERAVGK